MTNGRYKKTTIMKTKKMNLLKNWSVALFFLWSGSLLAGGPWLHKKNDGFIQVQATLPAYQYSQLLMGWAMTETEGVNRKTFTSDYGVYLEYGLTDKLNVISSLPFKYIKTGELTDEIANANLLPEGSIFGLSNYKVGFKYGLIDKKVKVALSAQTSWNTIQQDLSTGLATGFEANSYGLMAHVGRSSEKQYGFLELGYHLFTHNYSDAIELKIEHGWKIGNHIYLAGVLEGWFSMHNGKKFNANLAQTGASPNNQEWAFIGFKGSYEFDNGLGFNMGMPLIPIKFNLVGYNGAINLGAFKKF